MKYCKSGSFYVVRIDRGEEVISSLTEFCKKEQILSGHITGLGATDKVIIGLYSVVTGEYRKTELSGEMEITSIIGNISVKDDKPYLHLHINVCDSDMKIFGGHLNECHISATCELIVTPGDKKIGRKLDEEITGLNLYEF